MSVLTSILHTLFPTTCVACGEVLVGDERQICVGCLSQLARTGYSQYANNPTELRLTGKIPFEQATSLLEYRQASRTRNIVHAMKYHGNDELCVMMGRQMGLDLLKSSRFDDVDLLVPVPLHWWRRLQRGYNQSELLCRGIACNFQRPIESHALVRHRYTQKQSLQTKRQRALNVEGVFRVRHPEKLAGHHILLVDDVVTTGSTTISCGRELAKAEGVRISVVSMGYAGKKFLNNDNR